MTLTRLLSLNYQEKIGQLFFIGIPGSIIDDETKLLLDEVKPGGICLFARNIRENQQTRSLNGELQKASNIPLLISIDQEGGLVDRLRRLVTPMPSAAKLKNAEQVKDLAEITAKILLLLGFNMNFAPVVDVAAEQRTQFSNGLYSRAFGKNKETVADFAGVYLEKLQEFGITGCLKHFPGLGATEVDSHEELPIVNLTDRQLWDEDLSPYRELFKKNEVRALMTAHAAFPKTDLQETNSNGKLLPSSLSYNFITELLRNKLGYGKVVLTDDLEMGAVVKNFGIGEACRKAVHAGNDMLTICVNPASVREGFQSLVSAFENGELTEQRIDESLGRIAELKNSVKNPTEFDEIKLKNLSDEIAELIKNLE